MGTFIFQEKMDKANTESSVISCGQWADNGNSGEFR